MLVNDASLSAAIAVILCGSRDLWPGHVLYTLFQHQAIYVRVLVPAHALEWKVDSGQKSAEGLAPYNIYSGVVDETSSIT
jgi:hypothetical protein